MKTINDLLDLAKERNDLTSDRKLAIELKTGSLTRYRQGYDMPSDEVSIRLAKLCNMQPEVVIAICHMSKAKSDAVRKSWARIHDITQAASNIFQAGDEKKISDRIAA